MRNMRIQVQLCRLTARERTMTVPSHQQEPKVLRRPRGTIDHQSILVTRSRGHGTQPVDIVLNDEQPARVYKTTDHVVVEGQGIGRLAWVGIKRVPNQVFSPMISPWVCMICFYPLASR
jgi:hypothetical protein